MADGRMLKKTIANSRKLATVSDKAKVLWFMMLPHTDVEGRLKVCPPIVKGQYLTMLNYSLAAIQKALTELHNAGLIILYEVEGNQYAEFTRFKDFQSLRPDREGESSILPPDSGTTPGVDQENSGVREVKLREVKLNEDNNIFTKVLDHWNRQKENGPWKTHNLLTPDIRAAIRENLKEWAVEDMMLAISNFAMILQGKEYLWTFNKWGLREFLTRHERDNRKVLQWIRFHPNHFRESDWLTEAAQKKRAEQRIQYTKSIKASDPEKIKENYAVNKFGLNWLIRELRPEVINELSES
jgi:hypothetical protein